MNMKKINIIAISLLLLSGCSSYSPILTEKNINLKKFMGDWYVIANIPTFIEEGTHNAIESYKLEKDGHIATTFRFNKDSFDGEEKTYHPKGFIVDNSSNAIWEMQFIWPFKSDYRILYVNKDYTQTIIGRIKRDYVWIMARNHKINDADYKHMLDIIKTEGYDTSKIQLVPQQDKRIK